MLSFILILDDTRKAVIPLVSILDAVTQGPIIAAGSDGVITLFTPGVSFSVKLTDGGVHSVIGSGLYF
jgi:hypothetical protein